MSRQEVSLTCSLMWPSTTGAWAVRAFGDVGSMCSMKIAGNSEGIGFDIAIKYAQKQYIPISTRFAVFSSKILTTDTSVPECLFHHFQFPKSPITLLYPLTILPDQEASICLMIQKIAHSVSLEDTQLGLPQEAFSGWARCTTCLKAWCQGSEQPREHVRCERFPFFCLRTIPPQTITLAVQ